ncbi:hypothetical protein [Micromonospora sp. WMMD1082]|uniref:hypothetical protein n=1 Tax=Micromonospora sp. WMMD1082 TaxID=3016104 RepID=UPI002415EBA1|nr:hypothetical protein [Micromonospora sp. WMMD1082]MDG4796213.1 hypothetical protein [Micromonospora sp. WMMD1082]
MEIKLCKPAAGGDCYEPAVGTGKRPIEHCRPHYLDAIADEIVRAEVVGDVEVTDVRTGESVGRGGVVELDPVETAVVQLVYARHIKVLPKAEPARAKPAAKAG